MIEHNVRWHGTSIWNVFGATVISNDNGNDSIKCEEEEEWHLRKMAHNKIMAEIALARVAVHIVTEPI